MKGVRFMKKKKNLKKCTSIVCAMACILTLFLSSTTVHAEESITNDTIITKDNIEEVIEYLGLDKNSFISDETVSGNTYTVGEVYNLIQKLKACEINKSEDGAEDSLLRATGTKNLSHISYLDSYHVIIKVAAKYSGKQWKSAGAPKVSISQQQPGTTSKVGSNKLVATCDSSKIVLSGSVTIDTYLGIGKLGAVKINSNKISYSNVVWKASSYL